MTYLEVMMDIIHKNKEEINNMTMMTHNQVLIIIITRDNIIQDTLCLIHMVTKHNNKENKLEDKSVCKKNNIEKC